MENICIERPEGRLRVVAAGATGSPVLLLSGAGLDNALLSWKRLIPALAPQHRVLALDWPKQGESLPWEGLADHACLLQCIDVVLDHWGLDNVSLVGLSMGGALTLAYTLAHPERVARFVAIAPAGLIRFPPGQHQALWLIAKLPWLSRRVSTLLLRNRTMVAWLVRSSMFAGPSPDFDDVVDDILREATANGVGASDWQNDSIGFLDMKINLMPELHRITCPALFIQGDKDVGVNPKFTVEAASRIEGAQLAMLEGHGHWPNRQSPERVNALIAAFLAGESGAV